MAFFRTTFDADMQLRLQIGSTTIDIKPRSTLVTLSDGKQVPAEPHSTESYKETARKHGYGDDVGALCVDHEIGHVLLANFLGLSESPVFRSVADGGDDSELLGAEEDAVLAIQKFAKLAGVSLKLVAVRNSRAI